MKIKLAILITVLFLAVSCSDKKAGNNDQNQTTQQNTTGGNEGENIAESGNVPVEHVQAPKFKELVDGGEGTLLDVRTPGEYGSGHIGDAKLIDFYGPSFDAKVSELPKDKPVYIYCASGNRSSHAADKMYKMGFTKIYNLSGGISGWKANGFPVN